MTRRKAMIWGSAALLALFCAIAAFYFLCDPLGTPGAGKVAVDLSRGTKIYWNGKNVTGRRVVQPDLAGLTLHDMCAGMLDEARAVPAANFHYAVLNPETVRDGKFTVGSRVAFFWTADGEPVAYGVNGKRVKSIRFEGYSDDELVGVTPDAVIVEIKSENSHYLRFLVTDDHGVSDGCWDEDSYFQSEIGAPAETV